MKNNIICIILFILILFSFLSDAKNIDQSFYLKKEGSPNSIIMIFLNNPPFVPSNPIPANESTDVGLNIILSWTGGDPDPGDTVDYNIFFGKDSDPPLIELVHLDTTYNPGLLEYNTQYYWRIDAYDNNGSASSGPLWTFLTIDDTPPYTPSNPMPSNGAINVDINVDLNWTGGDPDPGDIVTYDVYFGVNPNPVIVSSNQSNITYDPGLLNSDTQYYWWIEAWDNYGYSSSSSLWSFKTRTNDPPHIPSNPIPANESINVDFNIDLNWTGGDPDINDTVIYDIYLDVNPNPSIIKNNQSIESFDPGLLIYDTQYYWKIEAKDLLGEITTGPIWTFRTEQYVNKPPEKPVKPNGTISGKKGISYSYSTSTNDPNEDKIYYMFDWDDGTHTDWIGPFHSGQTVTASHSWTGRGSYGVKVKARDEHNLESVWSDPLSINMPKLKNYREVTILQPFDNFLYIFGYLFHYYQMALS
jgi:hypothetical protein